MLQVGGPLQYIYMINPTCLDNVPWETMFFFRIDVDLLEGVSMDTMK